MTEETTVVETSSITLYGASDDLVEVEGQVTEEFDCMGPTRIRLIDPNSDDSLDVVLEYGAPGRNLEWSISVQAVNAYPSWTIRFHERPHYEGDPAVTIEAPVGIIVTEVEKN